MCGICGYITNKKLHDIEVIEKMLKALKHRGPDGAGTFKRDINQQSVLFGHTRLSIIDLDERANQPITFEHLTIVYNGEVYNFRDIKSELKTKGYTFFTSSDTEVVLKALHCWGLDACAKFNGMFALAIFDEIMKTVTLIRDRLGVKPFTDMKKGLDRCDIVMMLRLQNERMQGSFLPSKREYYEFYGLTSEKLKYASKDALIMHPGPMNRGVEIDTKLADDINVSLVKEQVELGVAVRMACLKIYCKE